MNADKMPPNSPRDVEMANVELQMPRGFSQTDVADARLANRASSDSASVPANLKGWYSTKSFKTVSFFLFCSAVLGITTSLRFGDKMNTDQYLGVVSSLLFLMAPSPLDLLKKNKPR
jgi:hypothetical protein